jgi:hypothetical protein
MKHTQSNKPMKITDIKFNPYNSKDNETVFIKIDELLKTQEQKDKCNAFLRLFNYFIAAYSRELFNRGCVLPPQFDRKRSHMNISKVSETDADKKLIAIRKNLTKYRQLYRNNPKFITESGFLDSYEEFVDKSLNTIINIIADPVYISDCSIIELLEKYKCLNINNPKPSAKINYEALSKFKFLNLNPNPIVV